MELINLQSQISYEAYKPLLNHFDISEKYFIDRWNKNPHIGYPQQPGGSLWTSEGKLLNCIIKKTKPKNILEIGTFLGVSTCHIMDGMLKSSVFHTVDIKKQNWITDLSNHFIQNDSISFLNITENKYDFIWIDGCHEYEHVKKEIEIIHERKLSRNILFHDYYVKRDGSNVGDAVDYFDSLYSVKIPVISPESNCGLVYVELKE